MDFLKKINWNTVYWFTVPGFLAPYLARYVLGKIIKPIPLIPTTLKNIASIATGASIAYTISGFAPEDKKIPVILGGILGSLSPVIGAKSPEFTEKDAKKLAEGGQAAGATLLQATTGLSPETIEKLGIVFPWETEKILELARTSAVPEGKLVIESGGVASIL